LVPAYLETVYRTDAFFLPTASLFTFHNIAYQGLFHKNTLFHAGFSWADFTPERLEYYDQINFMKAGLVYAHALNTISAAYAKEITGGEPAGKGLAGVLHARIDDLVAVPEDGLVAARAYLELYERALQRKQKHLRP
jgi:starch synthase